MVDNSGSGIIHSDPYAIWINLNDKSSGKENESFQLTCIKLKIFILEGNFKYDDGSSSVYENFLSPDPNDWYKLCPYSISSLINLFYRDSTNGADCVAMTYESGG